MGSRKSVLAKANPPKGENLWMDRAIPGMACLLAIVFLAWCTPSTFVELGSASPKDSYYNLLVQGFQAGQLNLKQEAPPELAKLANPYDPAANKPYTRYVGDMSYYRGKLYLYFGVTPVVVLLWPYESLTGHYLSDRAAIIIFCSLGILAAAGLLDALRWRYFSKQGVWAVALGILSLGLAIGALLGERAETEVYEVAASCGFAFAMLALAALWQAMHDAKRNVLWLLLASLAYELAIGARPSVLFGAIVLLIPAAEAWRRPDEPNSRRRAAWLLAAAIGPMALIGLGLMLYNDLRFGSPFEFGWRYELNADRGKSLTQFSLSFLGFNLRYYFWQLLNWSGHFPFLQMVKSPPLPPGYDTLGRSYGGILFLNCVVWLALAAPLAWRGRPPKEAPIRWFATAVFLLFAACAATDCLFTSGNLRYELDFLPALVLLSVMGMLGLQRTPAGAPGWGRIARWSGCALPAGSILFSALAGVEGHAQSDFYAGGFFSRNGKPDEAFKYFQSAMALEPKSAMFQAGLGLGYLSLNQFDQAIDQYQKAVKADPNNARLKFYLACCYWRVGRLNEAFSDFNRVFEMQPDFAATSDYTLEINQLAWSMATNPDPVKRNGALAVKMAEGVCQQTHYQVAISLETLGAAYAENGQFDEAISAAQKTLALVKQNGQTNLILESQQLLAFYLKHEPFRETVVIERHGP
jgi:tetratricopeptide (TPR) repeat protein